MPSSASNDGSGPNRGSSLRRWGPIVGIVAVIAVIATLVLAGGGDGDDEAETSTGETSGTGDTGSATTGVGEPGASGAISFSQAEEQGLDVTFPASCDPETGRVAIPTFFAPECFADVEDNGGATDDGVTADSIKVVVYVAPESDVILDFITAAIANDDTNAQVEETISGYTQMFQDLYQTYGRTVEIEFLQASGQSTDEVAARADAVRAVEEMGAFAVWGGPALTSAWSEEIAARDVICIGCFNLPDPDPNVFSVVARQDQSNVHLAEYILKKLAGKPAVHAGDEAMHEQTRVFAHLFIEASPNSLVEAETLAGYLEEGGASFAEQEPFTLDPARLQEQAATIITGFKEAGITTVVVEADPIAMATFTQVATSQEYFPEWVLGGTALMDTAAFGRTYDQEQWAHAFGISSLGAPTDPDTFQTLYEWYFGVEEAPANDSEGVLSPAPFVFFTALQLAGPNLTTETMREGLYQIAPIDGAITQPTFSYGDHGLYPQIDDLDQGGIDDFTEIWWDPDEPGKDELEREGLGMYRYVNGGERYFAGEWTEDLNVFEEEGAATFFSELPPAEAERVCDCPSPSG
jgi:hypothetical protein